MEGYIERWPSSVASRVGYCLWMRRRLRKKKHLEEFREDGFKVRAQISLEADFEAFIDRLIDAVEARRLGVTGGGDKDFQGFVAHLGRGTATEADREALGRFFAADPAVAQHEVGALVDAWYIQDIGW